VKPLKLAADHTLSRATELGTLDIGEFDAWLARRRWSWRELERGEYGITREQALTLFIVEDPVRWGETFLIEPDTGNPMRYWDYQKASLRSWRQHVVHQDGAEVGKTREIITLVLWGSCTSMGLTLSNPSMLIGAPQQTHLDEIIMAVEEQVGAEEGGTARGRALSQAWLKPKRTPHTLHRFMAPNITRPERPAIARVYYRPAGHDGEAFRGVHVSGLGMMDEAAKLKSKLHYTEFFRALMPTCRSRFYSVPDGDNATRFYALTQEAVIDLPEGAEGRRLFNWPKTLMPPPFFTPERDAQWVRDYGGRTSPGYVRNVLGQHGQTENPVWSWELLLDCVQELPHYLAIRLIADEKLRVLNVDVRRVALRIVQGRKHAEETFIADTALPLDDFTSADLTDSARRENVRALLRSYVLGDSQGVYFGGGDLGESNDPTELILSEQRGGRLVDVLRVHAKGLPYHLQRELIFVISELFDHTPHWGIDLGNAGSVVVKDLHTMDAYAEANFGDTLSGFNFAEAIDCVDEEGNALTRKDREGEEATVRAPAKHWATQCITKRLQGCGYAWPYDSEVLNHFANHTAKQGAKHVIYAKTNDHTIDARRLQMLRLLNDDTATLDVFSVGTYERNAA
jgi:hypothetical protein